MKKLFLSVGLALFLAGGAHAKTPAEVLKPYKAYKAALKEKNSQEASEQAYRAWQKAEELIGDARVTGDLADNFARSDNVPINGKVSGKIREQAFERAIELARFHGESAADVEIQRHLKFAEWKIDIFSYRVEGFNLKKVVRTPGFKKIESSITKYGKTGSTYGAELLAIKSQHALVNKKYTKAIEFADAAMTAFLNVTDGIPSPYKYLAQTYKAEALYQQNDLIESAIVHQDLMMSVEKNIGTRTGVSDLSYSTWLDIKETLQQEGKVTEMQEAGILDFKVPSSLTDELVPLIRTPPIMPSDAKRSGHVKVVFDIDDEGRVENAKVKSSSSKTFEAAAMKSLKGYRYTPNAPLNKRKGIETTITFRLSRSSTGKIIPE